jgi:hypothetical protein
MRTDVRMMFSVLALLVVMAVVMKLAATQMTGVKPVPAPGQPADPGARAVDLVNKAIEQGAVQRAADAASQ